MRTLAFYFVFSILMLMGISSRPDWDPNGIAKEASPKKEIPDTCMSKNDSIYMHMQQTVDYTIRLKQILEKRKKDGVSLIKDR